MSINTASLASARSRRSSSRRNLSIRVFARWRNARDTNERSIFSSCAALSPLSARPSRDKKIGKNRSKKIFDHLRSYFLFFFTSDTNNINLFCSGSSFHGKLRREIYIYVRVCSSRFSCVSTARDGPRRATRYRRHRHRLRLCTEEKPNVSWRTPILIHIYIYYSVHIIHIDRCEWDVTRSKWPTDRDASWDALPAKYKFRLKTVRVIKKTWRSLPFRNLTCIVIMSGVLDVELKKINKSNAREQNEECKKKTGSLLCLWNQFQIRVTSIVF